MWIDPYKVLKIPVIKKYARRHEASRNTKKQNLLPSQFYLEFGNRNSEIGDRP